MTGNDRESIEVLMMAGIRDTPGIFSPLLNEYDRVKNRMDEVMAHLGREDRCNTCKEMSRNGFYSPLEGTFKCRRCCLKSLIDDLCADKKLYSGHRLAMIRYANKERRTNEAIYKELRELDEKDKDN